MHNEHLIDGRYQFSDDVLVLKSFCPEKQTMCFTPWNAHNPMTVDE